MGGGDCGGQKCVRKRRFDGIRDDEVGEVQQ